MILVNLKRALRAYSERTGSRMTYDKLAELTGLSPSTLQSLASRESYNTTLSTIDKLCTALDVKVDEILEQVKIQE